MQAIGESVVSREAGRLADILVDQVVRACRYVICYDRYICKLEDEAGNLDRAMERVQHSVETELYNMKLILSDVQKWVEDAKSLASRGRGLLEREKEAEKTCFFGCIPNPKARHDFAKEATEIVKKIKELIPRVQFSKLSYNPPPGFVAGTSDSNSSAADGGDIITGSRASIFQDIMEALGDDMLKVIGVYGPGGVGKTTLLEEVEKKLREMGEPFRWIAKAKVSQTPDLKNIQEDIAHALGLELKDVLSREGRKDLLFKRLRKDPSEKILIILDDLWAELDLKEIGDPLGGESPICKLLLTSRDQSVLEQRMGAYPTFRLDGLSEEEAFRLFEKMVGPRLQDGEELKQIAAQVVKKLSGLPLLIESVASTLKRSPFDTWVSMLTKIEDPNTKRIVKWSYDHLESEDSKSLFLLCGLIGGTIRVELLLGLGMGLGLFEGFNETVQSSRNRLNVMLARLRSFCLLQDGGDDGIHVTIHDVYSEVVVKTPFRGQNSLMMSSSNSWSTEKLEKCWAICLTDIGSDRLAELMRRRFPHLEVLMLSQPGDFLGRPVHRHDESDCCRIDFTYMKQLRVLYIRSMHIPTLPSSIQILKNLLSLYLDCCDVEDVAILGKLKALQILSFAGSTISKLPKEIGDLTNLKSLNLSNCYKLKIIEPGVLEGLINLAELYMRGSFDRWMGNDEVPSESCNAKLAELKSLTKLSALEISIRDPTVLLEAGDLPFGNLIRFWINIGNVDGRKFEGLRTMKLKLGGCDSILSKEWIQKTLHKTQHLHLDGLGEFKKSVPELCIQGFSQLKHLEIDNSPSIEYIANSSDCLPLTAFANLEEIEVRKCDSLQAIVTDDGGKVEVAADDRVVLPNVRRLDLWELPNMLSFCTGAPIQVKLPNITSLQIEGAQCKELWNSRILDDSFCKLEYLRLENCHNLQRVASSQMWKRLHRYLEILRVELCPSIEIMYEGDETVTKGGKLRRLVLHDLENSTRIWQPDGDPNVPLPKLRFIELQSCLRLRMLFPTFLLEFVEQIKELVPESCEDMELIDGHEEC